MAAGWSVDLRFRIEALIHIDACLTRAFAEIEFFAESTSV
jgi:hypothetical protein